jgi:hypothetical protein
MLETYELVHVEDGMLTNSTNPTISNIPLHNILTCENGFKLLTIIGGFSVQTSTQIDASKDLHGSGWVEGPIFLTIITPNSGITEDSPLSDFHLLCSPCSPGLYATISPSSAVVCQSCEPGKYGLFWGSELREAGCFDCWPGTYQ